MPEASNPPDDTPLTFEDCRRHAYALMGDALDDLRHWNRADGLTAEQCTALANARRAITHAKNALNQAAQ
jgi:hypothetical protein